MREKHSCLCWTKISKQVNFFLLGSHAAAVLQLQQKQEWQGLMVHLYTTAFRVMLVFPSCRLCSNLYRLASRYMMHQNLVKGQGELTNGRMTDERSSPPFPSCHHQPLNCKYDARSVTEVSLGRMIHVSWFTVNLESLSRFRSCETSWIPSRSHKKNRHKTKWPLIPGNHAGRVSTGRPLTKSSQTRFAIISRRES